MSYCFFQRSGTDLKSNIWWTEFALRCLHSVHVIEILNNVTFVKIKKCKNQIVVTFNYTVKGAMVKYLHKN